MYNFEKSPAAIKLSRKRNQIMILMDESVYSMLIVECKFVMHKETFGKSAQEIAQAERSRQVIATLSQAPEPQAIHEYEI